MTARLFKSDLTVNTVMICHPAHAPAWIAAACRLRADFDFVSRRRRLPVEEFAERVRRIRREAVVAGHDALIVHTDMVGWFHTSNAYLRYVCDWMREGVLIIPTDSDKEMVLLSFFTQSVILPPGGEPVLVEEIWQIGAIGREYADRPGDPRSSRPPRPCRAARRTGPGQRPDRPPRRSHVR